MAEGVAGNGHDLEANLWRGQFDPVAVAYLMGGFADAYIDRCIYRHGMLREQSGHTADVIVMVMGQQDRAQLQPTCCQRLFDDQGIAGIDDDGLTFVVMQQPYVIVGQRR